ncbi:hypothetical protein Bca52824_036828 [Brassica carinata]|uniref:Uncharacterized protein n=1 Tax=Brassica carinata TaxID=52824 RepID=A0A8X7S6C8_BRACI|nr:hypothetical protein Bca52824_036828 [Brassica carinata]
MRKEEEEEEDMELVDDLTPLGNNNNNKNESGRLIGTVPDLELALGGEETRQEEEETLGLLPFLAGRSNCGEQISHSKGKEKEEEDDDMAVSASLSLSLSFPGEERKNADKTPLFLFRDLPR